MGILDRFRNQQPSKTSRGGSGRFHTGGFLQLDELQQDLIGLAGLRVFDKMYRTDPDIRRNIWMAANPIIGATWSVEAYGGDNASDIDRKAAEFVEWALFAQLSPKFKRHLAEALPVAMRSGFAPFEQVWTSATWEGKTVLVPSTLSLRLPRSIQRWPQDDAGQLTEIVQLVPNRGLAHIPAEDLVYYRFGAEGDNWEGTSLLRSAYKPWFLKDKLERIDAIAQEHQASGIPICYPPSGTDDEILDDVENILAGIRTAENGYILAPGPYAGDMGGESAAQGWHFDILTPKAGESSDVHKSLSYHSDKIAAAFLVEFMRLGQGPGATGARATAHVQENPFLTSVEAIAGEIEDTLNESLVARMVALNFEVEEPPRLTMSLVDSASLAELSTYVQQLVNAGALSPDPDLEDFLRERADLPAADAVARAAREKAAKEAPPPPPKGEPPPPDPAKPEPPTPPQPPPPAPVPDWAEPTADAVTEAENWVQQTGGLPSYIKRIAKHLQAKGKTEGVAIAIAVNAAKKMCATGDLNFPGLQQVNAGSRTEACAAVAEWERKKAQAHASDMRWWEEAMELDTLSAAIAGARSQFEDGAGDQARSLARDLAARAVKGKQPPAKPPAELVDALVAELEDLYATGRQTVRRELDAQRRGSSTVATRDAADGNSLKELRKRAQLAAQSIAARIWQAVMRASLAGSSDPAAVQGAGEAEAAAGLRAEAILHAAPALNLGRGDEADAHAEEIVGSRYTSILDPNRCSHCASSDDDVLRPLDDPVRIAHKPPNPFCEGGNRCRCMEFFQLDIEMPGSGGGVVPANPLEPPPGSGGDPVDYFVVSGGSAALRDIVNEQIRTIGTVHSFPEKLPRVPVEVKQMKPGFFGKWQGALDPAHDEIIDERIVLSRQALANDPPITSAVHEIGHMLDAHGFGDGPPAREDFRVNRFLSAGPALAEWRDAAMSSTAVRNLIAAADPAKPEYETKIAEVFARSYEQWIALRSGDSVLWDKINARRSQHENLYWDENDFRTIAAALDRFFTTRGLRS